MIVLPPKRRRTDYGLLTVRYLAWLVLSVGVILGCLVLVKVLFMAVHWAQVQ